MKRVLALVGAVAVGGSVLAAATAAPRAAPAPTPAPPQGQQVYLRKNCGHCHSLAAAGLRRTGGDAKMHGPDLSDVGRRFEHADLVAFLRKGDKVAGRRHWKSFWGEEQDLAALATWLSGFDKAVPAARAPAAPTPTPAPRP